MNALKLICLCGLTLALAGCASAVSSGSNTALDSFDLTAMTSEMEQSIMANPAIQQEIATHGALKIVCEPVTNNMTGEILPPGQARAYTAQIRSLLGQTAPDKFTWIMNRDEFYKLRNEQLNHVDLGPDPNAIIPQWALLAVFDSLTNEDENHRSAFYQCTYSITSLDHRTILWSHPYRVKKNAVKQFLD